ncbi:MAG TPA: class I SAM-dependent methyltransferase [Nitrospira sp.]|nr:class I SAM-dependent methyltransferase [Nitrospira sp.]
MSAQYDDIGAVYVNWKDTPIPRYAEVPTVKRLVSKVIQGRQVLDLACGTGYYSRLFKQWGAATVMGVDVSEAMVSTAREAESKDPLGIHYVVRDAADLSVLGSFDVAAATYLLHYAETSDIMRRMAKSIAANLKQGGFLLTLVPAPDYVMGQGDTEQYGFSYRLVRASEEWRLVHADVHTNPPFSIEYRHWARHVYEEALHAAGFADLQWHHFEVSPEGVARFSEAYWRDILENPVTVILTARLST